MDPQPSALAVDDDLDRVALAGTDLVEHGLARDAEAPGGLIEREVARRDVGLQPRADLRRQADPPWCVRGGLLGRPRCRSTAAVS